MIKKADTLSNRLSYAMKMLLGHSKDMDTYGVYAHTVDSQLLKISAEIDTTFEKIRKAAP